VSELSKSYYTEADFQELVFYQLPKVLFTNEKYKELSLAAKAVYAILRDRQALSIKNEWLDDKGRIYLIFTDNELADLLFCNRKSVMKYKKELIDYELLHKEPIESGLPDRLYILKPETRGVQKRDKGCVKKGQGGVQNLRTNNTELNKTDRLKQQQQPVLSYADVFLQTFGRYPTPMQLQELSDHIDNGFENDAIVYAIEKAGKAGASYLYAIGILKNWGKKGIFTLEQAEEEERNHLERKAAKNEKSRGNTREDKRTDLYW
jgi:DnaD/phage-associated family protein